MYAKDYIVNNTIITIKEDGCTMTFKLALGGNN